MRIDDCQTPNMEFFVKIVNNVKSSPVFAKSVILNVWQGSEYATACRCNTIPEKTYMSITQKRLINDQSIVIKQ